MVLRIGVGVDLKWFDLGGEGLGCFVGRPHLGLDDGVFVELGLESLGLDDCLWLAGGDELIGDLGVDVLRMEVCCLVVLVVLVDPDDLLVHDFSLYLDWRVVDLNWSGVDYVGHSVALGREVVDLLRIGVHCL